MHLGSTPYGQAWELQRALAGAVSQAAIPDTVLFLEHPPVVTLGRTTREGELHPPPVIDVVAPLGLEATRIDGLTGVWLQSPPRKLASIGVHVSRWVTTHGYALNVDLDPSPFTDWITACGLEDAQFTTMARELGRPLPVDDVRPAATAAIAEVFGLELEPLPVDEGHGL